MNIQKDDLDLYFKKFHPFVKNLINATPKSQIHTAAITDLKPHL